LIWPTDYIPERASSTAGVFMKTLFLHIGSHKTGTTSIQNALIRNKEELQRRSVSVFDRDPNGETRVDADGGNWIRSYFTLVDGRPDKMGTFPIDTESLFNYLNDYDGDVIFSSETLSWLNSLEVIDGLKREADKYFSKVVVIVYLRRQDQQAVSQHNQGSKVKGGDDHYYYLSNNRSLPITEDNYYEYLDYNKKIAIWADIFGDENIIVRVFDQNSLFGGDVVKDFFHIIGIPYNIKESDRNPSNGFEATKIGHLSNENLRPEISEMIKRGSDNSGKLMPSRADAKTFYSRYVESNIRLNQRFKISPRVDIFNDDFSHYPVEAQDLWGEDTANQAISNVLKSLDRAYGHLTIKKLKAIVLLLEDKNCSLARDVLVTILALNPEEDFVTKKLAEYDYRNTEDR
jgi:hypothetical protein